jgi:hypothetical protein
MNNTEKQINVNPSGEVLVIREGEAAPIYVYKGFSYTADSTDSLIALVKSKGVKENVIVAYNDAGIEVILDDTIVERKQDRLAYKFKNSIQFEEWEKILTRGYSFDQKEFIKFLQRREVGEIDDIDLLMASVQQFKYVTNIAGEFTYDDNNNYNFAIKIGDAEGTVKLPQFIFAKIEIYLESEFVQTMEIEMEVIRPKGEGEKPMFNLSCPKLNRYLQDAIDYEIKKLKTELDGYLIVAGNI